ncbi:hypothetical protein CGMCC3_g17105 [Colletotrichum fructicola]|nr:uncharacterized protein CGMCC3_g17105 [Colletotrichum fructicola]KAE9566739.1 hypothetical protein CGMCC3_g17105 [Colletotrichum fructicola]
MRLIGENRLSGLLAPADTIRCPRSSACSPAQFRLHDPTGLPRRRSAVDSRSTYIEPASTPQEESDSTTERQQSRITGRDQ